MYALSPRNRQTEAQEATVLVVEMVVQQLPKQVVGVMGPAVETAVAVGEAKMAVMEFPDPFSKSPLRPK